MSRYLLQHLVHSHLICSSLTYLELHGLQSAYFLNSLLTFIIRFPAALICSLFLYYFLSDRFLLSFPSSLKTFFLSQLSPSSARQTDADSWSSTSSEDLDWTALQECFRSQMKLRAVKTSSSREEFWNAPYCSTFCELDEREWRHIGSTDETCSPVKDCNHVQALPLWSGCAECSMVQWLYLRLNTPVSWLSFLEGRWSFNTSIRRRQHAGSFVPAAAGDTQENVRR